MRIKRNGLSIIKHFFFTLQFEQPEKVSSTLDSEKVRENSFQIWWHFIRKHLHVSYMYVRTRYMLPWDNFTQRQEVPSCEIAFITLTHFSCTKEGRKRGREKFHAHNSIWLCCLCQTRRNRRKKTGSGAHRFRNFRKFKKILP